MEILTLLLGILIGIFFLPMLIVGIAISIVLWPLMLLIALPLLILLLPLAVLIAILH